jgi:hypothetical protein
VWEVPAGSEIERTDAMDKYDKAFEAMFEELMVKKLGKKRAAAEIAKAKAAGTHDQALQAAYEAGLRGVEKLMAGAPTYTFQGGVKRFAGNVGDPKDVTPIPVSTACAANDRQ